MASTKSLPGFLCLATFFFSCFNEGGALYFSQDHSLTLNRRYVFDNVTIYNAQSILDPDDTGDITYKISPSQTKQNCPRLAIHPTLGSISVTATPKGFQILNATCSYSIASQLNGTAGMRNISNTEMKLTIMKTVDEMAVEDCHLLPLEELCFDGLHTIDVQVMENSEPLKIISLGTMMHNCQKKISVQYYLDSVGEDILSVQNDNSTGYIQQSLWTLTSLDREATSFYNFSITCSIRGEMIEATKNVTLPGRLTVLDQDDNPPESQGGVQHVTVFIDLRQHNVEEGSRLNSQNPNYFLVTDRDTLEVNHYNVFGLNDTMGILSYQTMNYSGQHTVTKSTYLLLQISLNKTLKDMKVWDDLYCVAVIINDTTLVKKNENYEMRFSVCLHWGHRIEEPKSHLTDEELKSLLSNGIYEARFPRKSSMHAIFMYPFPDLIRDNSEVELLPTLDFRIDKFKAFSHDHEDLAPNVYFGAEEQQNSPFSVTSKTGIIYATNPSFLTDSSMKYVSLQLTWRIPTNSNSQTDNRSYGANVTIFLDGDFIEDNNNGTDPCDMESCAEFSESHRCESSCGFGSSKHCSWIPRQNNVEQNSIAATSTNAINNLDYATCTASKETCPDGRCDELESLQPLRCPQDCATIVNEFTRLRPRANGKKHGIESGTGVCSCHTKNSCSCAHLPPSVPKPSISPDAPSSPGSAVQPSSRHYHETSFTEQPELGPIQTSEAVCGQTCIYILIALTLLFMGTVVSIVYVCKTRAATRRKSRNVKSNMSIRHYGMVISSNSNDSDYVPAGIDNDTYNGRTNAYYGCGDHLMVNPKWEIPRNCLLLDEVLGEGAFGRVLKGRAHNLPGHEGILDVAVKMLKDHNSENGKSCRQEFMQEFSLLEQVDHPNVIKLLGASTTPGQPPFLVMEYAELGSLWSFVRKCRCLESNGSSGFDLSACRSPANSIYIVTPQEVLGYLWQIAKGMAYLSDIKMVHRDLAARNILLTKSKVCKISDFGLTRDIYTDDIYKKTSDALVPVKWLALECLADALYTTKSDVWAFGILLWELTTLGASPHPGVQNEHLYGLLKSGYRMEKPNNCSTELFEIMLHCWASEAAERPTFHQLVKTISKLMENGNEYLNLDDVVSVSNPGYDCFVPEEQPCELKEATVEAPIAQTVPPTVDVDSSMENLGLIDHEISTNEHFSPISRSATTMSTLM